MFIVCDIFVVVREGCCVKKGLFILLCFCKCVYEVFIVVFCIKNKVVVDGFGEEDDLSYFVGLVKLRWV